MVRLPYQRINHWHADGASPAVVHYNLALVSHARGDQNAAREHLRQALGHDPQHAEARELQQRLMRKP